MEYLAGLAHALVSPVNCIGSYANELLQATGHFVQCVGTNVLGVAIQTGNVANATVDATAGAVTTVGNAVVGVVQ